MSQSLPQILHSTVIDTNVYVAWDRITTKDGLESWFVPEADLDILRQSFRFAFKSGAKKGAQVVDQTPVLDMSYARMYTFAMPIPDKYGDAGGASTRVTFAVVPLGPDRARFEIYHDGWDHGPDWQKAHDAANAAWSDVLARFVSFDIHGEPAIEGKKVDFWT